VLQAAQLPCPVTTAASGDVDVQQFCIILDSDSLVLVKPIQQCNYPRNSLLGEPGWQAKRYGNFIEGTNYIMALFGN
jgi:hypothetical protein